MRRLLALAALTAAALPVAGCGGRQKTQRDLVAGYIRQVDVVEAALAKPLGTVTQTGRQFASERKAGTSSPTNFLDLAHERALLNARQQIRALGRRLAAIHAPAAATRLRTLLLRLVARQAEMTHEVALMVTFVPQFEASLQPLAPATVALQRQLSVTQPIGYGSAGVTAELQVKATALRRYEAALGAVIARLAALRPPPASRPQYASQLRTLRRMRSDAAQLAVALVGNRTAVPKLLADFNSAASAAQSVHVQRAQIAAIRAYNSRARELDRIARDVERERARLAAHLT